jgi:DNA-binding PadR family transcriptional regulator
MSSVRLFILGTLVEHGPMHGHQIRAQAQEDRTELWTEIRAGALYGALKRLEREGLIEATRTERAGHFPERTVYGVTPDGRRALATVHDEALRKVVFRPDPFDLALAHSSDVPEETLSQIVGDRRAALAAQQSSMRHQLDAADPWLSEAERLVLEHVISRLVSEVAWHDELLNRLPKIAQDFLDLQSPRS